MSLLIISETIWSPPENVSSDSVITVRGFYTQRFLDSDGITPVQSGNGSNGFYYEIPCSLNGDGDLVVGEVVVHTTDDGSDINTSRFVGQLFVDGAAAQPTQIIFGFPAGAGWIIPASLSSPATWGDLDIFNQGQVQLIGVQSTLSANAIVNLIETISAGTSGSSGISGYSGDSGRSGYSGVSGLSGPSGASGFSGVSGRSGASGYSGTSGFSGTSGGGASGVSGYSGASGKSGFSGPSGASGISGYSGDNPGSSGVSGYSGVSGFSGDNPGTSGASGASGRSGYSGASGTSGASGASGKSGFTGASGTSGFSGISGYSGVSGFSGISGYTGVSGVSGFSGTPPTSVAFNNQSGTTYTLQESDNGLYVTCDNGSGVTVTIPSGLSVGFNCLVAQLGAGQVSFTTSSSTLHNENSHTKIAGQYGVVSLVSYTTDTFVLAGNTGT